MGRENAYADIDVINTSLANSVIYNGIILLYIRGVRRNRGKNNLNFYLGL